VIPIWYPLGVTIKKLKNYCGDFYLHQVKPWGGCIPKVTNSRPLAWGPLILGMPPPRSFTLHRTCSVFFNWRIVAKLRPEKCNFNQYKGFFMEKMDRISQISKEKKN
jgi:hypothetical protein